MNQAGTILEQHLFISQRKERDVFTNVFERVFTYPVSDIEVAYSDKPSEHYSTINNRTKKILLGIDKPEKIECIQGSFIDGGTFRLVNGNLEFQVLEHEYNYELIDSFKNFLSPVFPVWLFRNPYIWGATIYETYDRQHFFEVRKFSARSQLLEQPEVDIYQRDDGIIHKYRFFTKDEFEPEEGLRFLTPYFTMLKESLRKRNYEVLEVFNLYCTDIAAFRRCDPRTKPGKEIKSILAQN